MSSKQLGLTADAAQVESVERSRVPQPTGEVHPVADLFPMMTDDELDDLAADIKENGLLHPIVLDANGMLIDGRNRLAGCWRAGVEPTFAALNGHDPVAFIIAANVARRHLTKGQQAMAIARANRLQNNHSTRRLADAIGAKRSYLPHAEVVLDYAMDLADAVLFGATPLNEAYEEARRRKEAAQTDEARFARLQAEWPDLAAMVLEERLTLHGAIAEAFERMRIEAEREQEERSRRERRTRKLNEVLVALDPAESDPEEWSAHWLEIDPEVIGDDADFSAGRARRAAVTLLRYADLKEAQENGKV